MNIVFLDDDERRHEHVVSILKSIKQAYSADEAIEIIKRQDEIDYLFLDHDLGGAYRIEDEDDFYANTGLKVAKWVAKNKPDIGTIVLHTINPVGCANMCAVLQDVYDDVRAMKYYSNEFNHLLTQIK